MKNILSLLAGLFLAGGICYAQPVASSGANAMGSTANTAAENTPVVIQGAIDAVAKGDPAQGTKSNIIVSSEAGKLMVQIIPTTTIYDADSNVVALDQVKMGEKVKIKYTIRDGVAEAESINLLRS